MDPLIASKVPENLTVVGNDDDDDVEGYQHRVEEMASKVNKLERRVQEIESFYLNSPKRQNNNSNFNSLLREKDKVRHATSFKKQRDTEADAFERMQDLMCQFGKIFNQVTQRRGVQSSLDFMGMNDLGLHDSSEVTGKPRDFSAIRRRMEAKDNSGYKHVKDIYADVRSVLKNAIKSNDERSDAHATATTMLDKFEDKWLLLLPKVMQEDERRKEEEDFQKAQHARMAKDISSELYEVEDHLKKLRELVVKRCRKMSALDKRELGKALTQLSADDLRRALEIVAQSNPAFQASAEEVDLDIDAQDEFTLRQLKYFISDVRQAQGNHSKSISGDDSNDKNNKSTNASKPKNPNTKRKRLSDELAKVSKKRAKKPTV